MSTIQLLTADLLAQGWQWHDGAPQRIQEELARLDGIPYFQREHYSLGNARELIVVGVLSNKLAHGRIDHFRVRLEYPDTFPGQAPRIFDHDRIFEPSADGHLFSTGELCLTFPEREEFGLGKPDLSREVLGASLIWFHKRCIFERNGRKKWPGITEPHGWAAAHIVLLLDQSGLLRNAFFLEWVVWVMKSHESPRPAGLCPCNSGRIFIQCHLSVARRIYDAIVGS